MFTCDRNTQTNAALARGRGGSGQDRVTTTGAGAHDDGVRCDVSSAEGIPDPALPGLILDLTVPDPWTLDLQGHTFAAVATAENRAEFGHGLTFEQ